MSFLNLLKSPSTDLETQIRRLAICKRCKDKKGNKNIYNTGQCKDCLCFVVQKVKHKTESCPRNYW
jgi:hypothetical protein